jgi:hypothetical protein
VNLIKNKSTLLLTLIAVAFTLWWLSFQDIVQEQGLSVQWFGGTYGVIALIGSIIGFSAAQKWGGFKTVLGKALMFFSLGLLAQEVGQLIYTYYVYGAKIQIPYPSWGDAAYFGSVLLYITAAVYLTRLSGAKFTFKRMGYKVVAFLIPVLLLATSYWVFLHNHQYDTTKPVTVFLDFGYPMGQAIYISLAITAYLLSRKMLGGLMRTGIILMILALFTQYISDFSFLYQSSRGTYLAGRWVDLLYLTSYFLMSVALIQFLSVYKEIKRKGSAKTVTGGTNS